MGKSNNGPMAEQTMAEQTFKGACLCGAVQWECDGLPVWSLICHCSLCRRCHSAAYAEMVGYAPENFRLVTGQESLSMYNLNGTNKEDRHFCTKCSSACFSILNQTPNKMRAVHLQNFTYPNHGPDGSIDPRFAPTAHIFYSSGTAVVKDGLPKFDKGAKSSPVSDERQEAAPMRTLVPFTPQGKWSELTRCSRAVRTNNTIQVSGATCTDKQKLGAYEQVINIFEQLEKALHQAGGTLDDVTITRFFASDAEADWQELARAHGDVFGNVQPACTLVGVKLIQPWHKVEIELTAEVGAARAGTLVPRTISRL